MRTLTIATLALAGIMLSAAAHAQTVNICDRTPAVRDALLEALETEDCAAVDSGDLADIRGGWTLSVSSLRAGDFDGLTRLQTLSLTGSLTSLPVGVFDGLSSLRSLSISGHQLASLPSGLFGGLDSLESLRLSVNQLTSLTAGLFDGLGNLTRLYLGGNRLTTLPAGLFRGLDSLELLHLNQNVLATLPAGLFDGLGSLAELRLDDNHLTTLPAGLFDGLSGLGTLNLQSNRLTTLPAGLFDGLYSLTSLRLGGNRLTTLPAGLFDDLYHLARLGLGVNWLVSLPDGLFDSLDRLRELRLSQNHLVGLTIDDPLFAGLPPDAQVQLDGQTDPPDDLVRDGGDPDSPSAPALSAALPLLLSASHSGRQGFVRIVNTTDDAGTVRISAIDYRGETAGEVELKLAAKQAIHFNSRELENGNPDKGIDVGVGSPGEGDWRLAVESELNLNVLAYVRTSDGFLTAMHDVLEKDADGSLAARTFNPASNMERQSRLRLTNTGDGEASVSIEGVDDAGESATVTLTLPAGRSRTLTAIDLEEGAMGLTGILGDGRGKWRLFIDAPNTVTAMSLLYSSSGQISNLSTMGHDTRTYTFNANEGGGSLVAYILERHDTTLRELVEDYCDGVNYSEDRCMHDLLNNVNTGLDLLAPLLETRVNGYRQCLMEVREQICRKQYRECSTDNLLMAGFLLRTGTLRDGSPLPGYNLIDALRDDDCRQSAEEHLERHGLEVQFPPSRSNLPFELSFPD